jgi:DNA-binding winged helix-turn-helix (wHTH) protein/tetratricopeptide (TPR) repeat protein/TolB-like protein
MSQDEDLSVSASELRFGDYHLDRRRHLLFRGAELVDVPPKALDVLRVLAEHGGELVTKEELLRRVWPDTFVEEANLAQNVFVLRRLLDGGLDGPSLIETFPRRGYRLNLQVHRGAPARRGTPGGDSSRARAVLIGLGLVGALGIAAFLLARPGDRLARPGSRMLTVEPPVSVAVLPLREPPGSDPPYLGVGLADALVRRLSRERALVVRPTSAGQQVAEQPPEVVARALGVQWVVSGQVRREDSRLAADLQLRSAGTDEPAWRSSFAGELGRTEDLVQEMASDLIVGLTGRLPEGRPASVFRLPTGDVELHLRYLEARYHAVHLTDLKRAITLFREVIDADPTYAPAYGGLAFAYMMSNELALPPAASQPYVRLAALEALRLDPDLTEARVMLAMVQWQYDWRLPQAEESFRLAIRSNPNDASAHIWFAFFLGSSGRAEEAEAEIAAAQRLDPRSLEIQLQTCGTYYLLSRFETALGSCGALLELDPGFWLAHSLLGRTLEQLDRREEALEHFRQASELAPHIPEAWMDRARAAGLAGLDAEAREATDRLLGLAKDSYVSPYQLAMAALGRGDLAAALDLLEEAARVRSWYITWLPSAPELAPLRDEPRFSLLVQRFVSGSWDG